jgi:hypothetical protein
MSLFPYLSLFGSMDIETQVHRFSNFIKLTVKWFSNLKIKFTKTIKYCVNAYYLLDVKTKHTFK